MHGQPHITYLVSEVGTGVGTLGGKTGMGVPLRRTAPPGPRPNTAWWLRGRFCSLVKDPSMSQSQPELAWNMSPMITANSLLRYVVSLLQTWNHFTDNRKMYMGISQRIFIVSTDRSVSFTIHVQKVCSFVVATSFWKRKTTVWQAIEILLGVRSFWKSKITMWQSF